MLFGGIYTNLIHIENGWISSNAVPTVLETSKTTAYVSLHSADNPIIKDQILSAECLLLIKNFKTLHPSKLI